MNGTGPWPKSIKVLPKSIAIAVIVSCITYTKGFVTSSSSAAGLAVKRFHIKQSLGLFRLAETIENTTVAGRQQQHQQQQQKEKQPRQNEKQKEFRRTYYKSSNTIRNEKDNETNKKPVVPEEKDPASLEDRNGKGEEFSCRVVATSDGKIPAKKDALPEILFQSPTNLIDRLDSIYNAMAHSQTRRLDYSAKGKKRVFDEIQERELFCSLRSSLEDAGFQCLSQRDFDLCSALNAGYLLRLSLVEDLSNLDPTISQDFYPELFSRKATATTSQRAFSKKEQKDLLFNGQVLVFRRGYSQEVTPGRHLLPKLDYFQSSVVQRLVVWFRGRLDGIEESIVLKVTKGYQRVRFIVRSTIKDMIKQVDNKRMVAFLRRQLLDYTAELPDDYDSEGEEEEEGTKKKRSFMMSRYGGSKFVASTNPTDALTPFMIREANDGDVIKNPIPSSGVSVFPPPPPTIASASAINQTLSAGQSPSMEKITCQYDEEIACTSSNKRNNPPPAIQLLERISISNVIDFFSKEGRRGLIKKFYEVSNLVEPTYEEVVVIWRPNMPEKTKTKKPVFTIKRPKFLNEILDMFDMMDEGLPSDSSTDDGNYATRVVEPRPPSAPLEIRAFTQVPMANILAVLPQNRLIFKSADALLFDLISIITFALVISSQKFDSPKLDILALVSVLLWSLRTFFRYSNKLARYDLLVKKFLTSKISQRNSGALRYISSEAASQRAIRAALVHSWLSLQEQQDDKYDGNNAPSSPLSSSRKDLIQDGRRGVNQLIDDGKEVQIDIDAAFRDLEGVGLIKFSEDGATLTEIVHNETDIVIALENAWANVF